MGEYKSSFMVFLLLIIAIIAVAYYIFHKDQLTFNKINEIINNYDFNNSDTTNSNYNKDEDFGNNYNDYETNYISADNNSSELYRDNPEENNLALDIVESVEPTKKVSKFDIDFTRTNEKTEPDITSSNALKLRSLGGG